MFINICHYFKWVKKYFFQTNLDKILKNNAKFRTHYMLLWVSSMGIDLSCFMNNLVRSCSQNNAL